MRDLETDFEPTARQTNRSHTERNLAIGTDRRNGHVSSQSTTKPTAQRRNIRVVDPDRFMHVSGLTGGVIARHSTS